MDRRTQLSYLLFIIGLVMLFTTGRVFASVELSSFVIIPGENEVLLIWETGSEFNFSGFYVHRNSVDDGSYGAWTPPIPVVDEDGVVREFIGTRNEFGATYQFTDENVVDGEPYCYALRAINTDNADEYFPSDPVCVGPTPTPTNTPAATATPDATLTPSPTASLTATNTGPTRTPTNTSAAPATSRPTRTPQPSATETQPPTETPTTTPTSTVTQTPTYTPFPTFLPTWTSTPTITPSPTQTLSPTPTQGPLLAATLSADEPGEGLFQVGEDTALTLGELILSIVGLVALVGGLLFGLIYFFILRNTNQ